MTVYESGFRNNLHTHAAIELFACGEAGCYLSREQVTCVLRSDRYGLPDEGDVESVIERMEDECSPDFPVSLRGIAAEILRGMRAAGECRAPGRTSALF